MLLKHVLACLHTDLSLQTATDRSIKTTRGGDNVECVVLIIHWDLETSSFQTVSWNRSIGLMAPFDHDGRHRIKSCTAWDDIGQEMLEIQQVHVETGLANS